MNIRLIRAFVLGVPIGVVCAMAPACGLLVQFDRGAVEVDETGCPICSDAADDGDAADAPSTDRGGDGGREDASAEGSTSDSGNRE